jgi:hypothetical protein
VIAERLFLKANDIAGCDVISSLLQDSLFHISAISFHTDRKCLRLMLNRFCWETIAERLFGEVGGKSGENSPPEEAVGYFRVHSGLYIHNVEQVIVNENFKKHNVREYMNLLTLHSSDGEINMIFSGDRSACIKTNHLSVHLKDLHDKYPSPSLPQHF